MKIIFLYIISLVIRTIIYNNNRAIETIYRKVSNIRRTTYQNLNDSRLILQLSVPIPLKPSVKSIMKM